MSKSQWLSWLQSQAPNVNERRERKPIKTYGTFRNSEIQSIMNISLREDKLRNLLIGTLQLRYLYNSIDTAIKQQSSRELGSYMARDLIKVLNQGLFSRHLIKSSNICEYDGSLLQNHSTQTHIKVIIACVIISLSKRLSLGEIVSCLKIFYYQQLLIGEKKSHQLSLDTVNITKTLQKIQRLINTGDLRNIFAHIKQENKANVIKVDQFLFLASITIKKSGGRSIFAMPNIKQDILELELSDEIVAKKEDEQEQIKIPQNKDNIQGLCFYKNNFKVNQSNKIYKEVRKNIISKQRAKSQILEKELKKNLRPQSSPFFRKSIQIMRQKSKTLAENFQKPKEKIMKNNVFLKNRHSISLRKNFNKCKLKLLATYCPNNQ